MKNDYSALIGERSGKLLVIGMGEKRGFVQFMKVHCDCGNEKEVSYYHLKSKHVTSCGNCIQGKDYTGEKYGRLTVLGFSHKEGRHPMWSCQCECGNVVVVSIYNLLNGKTLSCGCIKKNVVKYGYEFTRFSHIYDGINKRCNQVNSEPYSRYGAKGIKNLRTSIKEFKDDMYESYLKHVEEFGEKQTTIDRIDNNGNYCKENCRWATIVEQARNKKTSRYITYKGETKTIKEFANKFGLTYKVVYYRLKRGWSVDRSLETR